MLKPSHDLTDKTYQGDGKVVILLKPYRQNLSGDGKVVILLKPYKPYRQNLSRRWQGGHPVETNHVV